MTARSKASAAVSLTLRVVLAAVFVLSAVAKLMAIDDFELYVYSFGFLPLDVVYVAVRLCIGAEFVAAAMLVSGWRIRLARLAVVGMLVFFSLFLCYAALLGRNESCQCFGRLADMPPAVSLLKNAVLILLVLVYYRLLGQTSWVPSKPAARIVSCVVTVVLMVVPFVVSVPDSWLFGPAQQRFDTNLMDSTIREQELDHGHKLVAFVTPGCPYCRMTRSKLSSMAERNHLDTADMVYITPSDIGAQRFLDITYGQRPLVLLLDEGEPVATFHYRNISERQVSKFLKK